MPSLSEVLAATRECDVEVGQGVFLHIVYDPNVYTPEAEAEWTAAEANGVTPGNLTADFLSKLLKKWDLQEDTPPHRVIPITEKRLRQIPFALLTQVLDGITKDLGKEQGPQNREQRRAQTKKKQRS